jgi:hypothetical protein
MSSFDLEGVREIFKDQKMYKGVGLIKALGLALDNSKMRVRVSMFPDSREITAVMAFSDPNDINMPQPGDMVLVEFIDGDPDDAFVTDRCTSIEEPIPLFARTGHAVKCSWAGKKLYLGSDTKVGIGRPDVEPTSPLVLGDVLSTLLGAIIDAMVTNLPTVGSPAGAGAGALATALSNLKTTYLTTTASNILSQIAYTERGV